MTNADALAVRAVAEWGAQQKPGELAELAHFVRGHGYKRALEIGTYSGGTARFLRALGLRVTALDRDLSHLAPAARTSDVRWLEGESGHLACGFEDASLDIVFIDGDHSLPGVIADWEEYRLKVGPGGIVAFHDIVEHDPPGICSVDVFWAQLKAAGSHRTSEIIDRDGGPWAGIGVVEAKEKT